MALPKRNILIRILYSFTLFAMCGFLLWQSLPMDMEYNTDTVHIPTLPKEKNQTITASAPAVKQSVNSSSELKQIPSIKIFGMTQLIDLSTNPSEQINNHWQAFFTSPVINDIDTSNPLFAVYTNFNRSNNTILLTLGFKEPLPNNAVTTISLGSYKQYNSESVLDIWQQTASNYQQFLYKTDFEIWMLDKQFQPILVASYIGIK